MANCMKSSVAFIPGLTKQLQPGPAFPLALQSRPVKLGVSGHKHELGHVQQGLLQ
jgi:hypothetical protein